MLEQSDGLLITKNKRIETARKWHRFTDKVIAILNSSILKGFDKLWVEGLRGDINSLYLHKSHEKQSLIYLVGLKKDPENVSIITVNKSNRNNT